MLPRDIGNSTFVSSSISLNRLIFCEMVNEIVTKEVARNDWLKTKSLAESQSVLVLHDRMYVSYQVILCYEFLANICIFTCVYCSSVY